MKNYPYYKIFEATNLRDLVRRAADAAPAKTAYAYQLGERIHHHTFLQFKDDIESLGTFFYSIGLRDGAKIAVMGENSYYWLLTYFAAATGGNIIVPLDKELPAEDLLHLLRESGAEAVVYSDDYADTFDSFSENNRKLKLSVSHYINMKRDLPLALSKGASLVLSGARDFIYHEINNDNVCTIVYTSGTTGLSKGVMLTNKNIVTTTREALRIAWVYGDTVLVLPLHHTYPFSASVLPPLFHLSTCFINSNLKHVLRDIQTAKPQFLCVVPLYVESFHKKIWENVRKQGKEKLLRKMFTVSGSIRKFGVDLRKVMFGTVLKAFGGKLETLVSGGAPLNKQYIDEFAHFGIQILEGYGITECSPIVALNRNKFWKHGAVGIALPSVEVKIFDVDKEGAGEICVRGDIVMKGYYNNPQATKDAFNGDWFRTGDIGYMDDDGFVFITGRQKNVIIRANGKNVHPEELEGKLSVIEHVKEIAVYGDDGDDIVAEIFIDPEQKDRKQLEKIITKKVKMINENLPIYKRVNKIKFRDIEFDKTTTKKIKRYNLKKMKD
ncbi:MAG: AMP-binding protein [Chitinispirillia bacterium]|nr:AMP-binding protein [Chitinispirillia bacterium]